ncbi:MAG TPA: DMT family transporter [Anaerolineaceae bacterium]|nr:DMT family transporter [Anaerolineaceae bacterium]HQH84300.1 DMT family transporter [Anaerolineaceae bacterium]
MTHNKEGNKKLSSYLIFGIVGALLTGLAIGTQSTLSGRIGMIIGNLRTGILMNLIGGGLAGILLLILIFVNSKTYTKAPPQAWLMLAIAGALGIVIITGVSFSLQRAGVAAGLGTIILGQMVVSVIADARGWGGADPIPVTLPRILGLLLLAAGVFLLLPKR